MITRTRDPLCVYVADNTATAVIIADFLNNAGVPAKAMGIEAGTMLPPAAATGEAEVWVDNLSQVEEARRLITEQEKDAAQQVQQKLAQGPVDAICEDCGKHATFPADQRGTTQVCPHCGEYMDVVNAPEVAAGMAKGTDAV